MKISRPLSNLPELRDLDDAERAKVIQQWECEATKPWSGYLLRTGLSILVIIAIICLPELLFRGLRTSDVQRYMVGAGAVLAVLASDILYKTLILSKRRDLLQRILEERRSPVCMIGSSVGPIRLTRAWFAVISYCLLLVGAPLVFVCFAWRYRETGMFAASLILLFVLLAVCESGFRIWRRIWRIP